MDRKPLNGLRNMKNNTISLEVKLLTARKSINDARKVAKNRATCNRLGKLAKGLDQLLTKQGLLQ